VFKKAFRRLCRAPAKGGFPVFSGTGADLFRRDDLFFLRDELAPSDVELHGPDL
jgi:hypothetical protein